MRPRPALLATSAVVLACSLPLGCRSRSGDEASQTLSSQTEAYKGFTSLFTVLVGRKPKPNSPEDGALYDKDHAAMVDKILASKQFANEGFFNAQRDRLVLQLYEKSPEWTISQHPSYCAMQREMQDVAREDREGSGYWSLVNYKERWVPLDPQVADCFVGTSVAVLADALKTGTSADAVAGLCVANSGRLGKAKDDLVAALAAVPADQRAKAPIDTAAGQGALAAFLTGAITTPAAAAPGTDLQVVFTKDPAGRLQLTEEYDPNQLAGRCSFRDLPPDAASWKKTPTSTVMVRATLSPKLVGVMANPFWNARHPTNAKNRGLHRARVVLFSYFCREVSPAAAALAGGTPQVVPELAPYFPPGDVHPLASQNCYDCHTTIQPFANFFGVIDQATQDADGRYAGYRYLQNAPVNELPGGWWSWLEPGKGKFYGKDGVHYNTRGLQGLANVLSDKDSNTTAQCVVSSAWSALFGREHDIPDAVKTTALAAFRKGNPKGSPSLTEVYRSILKSDFGRTFYSSAQDGGREAFNALLAAGKPLDCADVTPAAAVAMATAKCYKCHNTKKKEAGFAAFTFGTKELLPIAAETKAKATCKLKNDEMPPEGLEIAEKKVMRCFFHDPGAAEPNCGDDPAGAAVGPDTPAHAMPEGPM